MTSCLRRTVASSAYTIKARVARAMIAKEVVRNAKGRRGKVKTMMAGTNIRVEMVVEIIVVDARALARLKLGPEQIEAPDAQGYCFEMCAEVSIRFYRDEETSPAGGNRR